MQRRDARASSRDCGTRGLMPVRLCGDCTCGSCRGRASTQCAASDTFWFVFARPHLSPSRWISASVIEEQMQKQKREGRELRESLDASRTVQHASGMALLRVQRRGARVGER